MKEPRTIPPQRRASVIDVGPFPESEATTPPPVTSESLRREYPKWLIWESDRGRWWANREGDPTPAQMNAGARVGLDADTIEELADLLFEQERLREGHR